MDQGEIASSPIPIQFYTGDVAYAGPAIINFSISLLLIGFISAGRIEKIMEINQLALIIEFKMHDPVSS